jgi:hypothetical protein
LEISMKYGRSLVDLATELERQLATKQDMIVPTPLMHHVTSENGTSVLNIETHDGVRTFRTTENCRRQLADRLKIPFAYFERMRTDQPALLDRNIDTGSTRSPSSAWCARSTATRGRSCRTATAGWTTTTCWRTSTRCCVNCPAPASNRARSPTAACT